MEKVPPPPFFPFKSSPVKFVSGTRETVREIEKERERERERGTQMFTLLKEREGTLDRERQAERKKKMRRTEEEERGEENAIKEIHNGPKIKNFCRFEYTGCVSPFLLLWRCRESAPL